MSGEQIKPGYKRTEVGVIPADWGVHLLEDICKRITTGKLDANAMVKDGIYPFFTCARERYFINDYAFDDEALLVSGNGANVGYIHYYDGKFNAYQRTYVLTGFTADIQFSKLFMEKSLHTRLRTEVNAGNTPYIVMDTLAKMSIPIPPTLHEQRSIATALSDVDALLTKLDQLIAKKRDLKQATMQQLLTGQTRLPGFSGEWEVKRLGGMLAYLGNGAVYKPASSFGFPVTRIETIADGTIDFSRVGYAVPTDELKKYRLKKGDILYSHINSIDHIGKVAIYESETALYHGMNLLLLRPSEAVLSRYLFYWLGSRQGRKQSATLAKQAVSQASINTVELKGLELLLPTVDEQTAIAAVLYDLDAELATLEARRDKTHEIKKGMMQELLTGKVRLQLSEGMGNE